MQFFTLGLCGLSCHDVGPEPGIPIPHFRRSIFGVFCTRIMVLYDIFLWVRRSAFSLFLKNKNCNLFVLLCLKIHFGLFIFLQGNQTHWAFRSHDLCHDFRRHVHFQYHLHHFSIWIYPIVFLSVERKRRR